MPSLFLSLSASSTLTSSSHLILSTRPSRPSLRVRKCHRVEGTRIPTSLYAVLRVVKRESTRTRCQGKYVLAMATNLSWEARMARSHGKMDLRVTSLFAVVWATGYVGWWNGLLGGLTVS
jgi:hypothetical protein